MPARLSIVWLGVGKSSFCFIDVIMFSMHSGTKTKRVLCHWGSDVCHSSYTRFSAKIRNSDTSRKGEISNGIQTIRILESGATDSVPLLVCKNRFHFGSISVLGHYYCHLTLSSCFGVSPIRSTGTPGSTC